MNTHPLPRDSWWTRSPREAWRLVLEAEQPHMANSPEGKKNKLLTFEQVDGGRKFMTARQLQEN